MVSTDDSSVSQNCSVSQEYSQSPHCPYYDTIGFLILPPFLRPSPPPSFCPSLPPSLQGGASGRLSDTPERSGLPARPGRRQQRHPLRSRGRSGSPACTPARWGRLGGAKWRGGVAAVTARRAGGRCGAAVDGASLSGGAGQRMRRLGGGDDAAVPDPRVVRRPGRRQHRRPLRHRGRSESVGESKI